jgi:hypothetical protein
MSHTTAMASLRSRPALLLALLMLCGPVLATVYDPGQPPRPPCGGSPHPAWPDAPGQLAIAIWDEQQLAAPWQPPPCTGWGSAGFSVLLAASGRLNGQGIATRALARLGRISLLSGLRYWSVSRDRWTILVEQAYALRQPDQQSRRPDFRPEELDTGRDYYYWQHEPTTSGSAIYSFRLLERSPGRLVVSVRNTTATRRFGLTLLPAGEAESLYFIERLADGDWGYYQLTRLGHGRLDWLAIPRASYANRANALFRHLAELPEGTLPIWQGD